MPKWIQEELPFEPPIPRNFVSDDRRKDEISQVLERRLRWIENEIGAIRSKLNALSERKK